MKVNRFEGTLESLPKHILNFQNVTANSEVTAFFSPTLAMYSRGIQLPRKIQFLIILAGYNTITNRKLKKPSF